MILAPAALWWLASCQSGNDEPALDQTDSRIDFTTEVSSRGEIFTGSNITNRPFLVFGEMRLINASADNDYIKIFDGTKVEYNKSAGKWLYDGTGFWFPNFQHTFAAVYPEKNVCIRNKTFENNSLKLSYTQASNYASAEDLLVATHRRNYTGGKAEIVKFEFAHILSNVNIQVSYRGPSYGPSSITVTHLTFNEFPTSATFTIKPAPLTGGSQMTSDWVYEEDTYMGWSLNNTGTLYIPFKNKKAVQTNGEAVQLFSSSDPLIVLPNPDESADPIELELSYTTNTGEEKTAYATLPINWNPGSSLNLSLEIINDNIQFSYDIEDWEVGANTNTTVPRK